MSKTFVVGVGMTAFAKPGTKQGDYPDWAVEAGRIALNDAGLRYEQVERAFAGYVYGDSTSGQRALYGLGETGIPIVNVNNNCSTGSSALYLARETVRGGLADCVLAIGFEKMYTGSLKSFFDDRVNPLGRHLDTLKRVHPDTEKAPFALKIFGAAARHHMATYGSTPRHLAWIGWKNHKHAVNNPYAQFQDSYTLRDIEESIEVYSPLTKLQCSANADGAAAAIVVSERFVDEHRLWDRAVEIAGQALVSDFPSSFAEDADGMSIVGYDLSVAAAQKAFAEAGISIGDADVIELHDCFTPNELITYEALGLADPGEGHLLVEAEATTYGGGGPVVNPSGGLISKGHPLGATGLAQCTELVWQLRGKAGPRQVDGAQVAVQHNAGLGSAVVVGVYRKV